MIFDPTTGNINGTGRLAFDGNIIPANRINPITTKRCCALIPQPNLTGDTNNFYNSAPKSFDRNNYDVKINWNRTANHQIWFKFSHMKADVTRGNSRSAQRAVPASVELR